MIGLETLLPLGLLLVEQNMLDLPQLIEKLTSAPAEILGLDSGNLSVGSTSETSAFSIRKPNGNSHQRAAIHEGKTRLS